MGRFAYIPLDFNNLHYGLEREVAIKKDTDDLYVLDDYKVPVTVTKNIREMTSDLPNDIDQWYNKMIDLNNKFIEIKLRCQEYEKTLDEYINIAKNDLYKRLEALKDYYEWLKNLFNEIKRNSDYNNEQLPKIINNYNTDIDKILQLVNERYNENKPYLDEYKEYKKDYDDLLVDLVEEIKLIKEDLEKKLLKLGKLKIKAKSDNKPKPTTCLIRVYANQCWLTNPSYSGMGSSVYPGNNPETNVRGFWSYDDYPIKMNDAAFEIEMNDDFYGVMEGDRAFTEAEGLALGINPNTYANITQLNNLKNAGILTFTHGDNEMCGWGRGNFYPSADSPTTVKSGRYASHGGHCSINPAITDYTSKWVRRRDGWTAGYVYEGGSTISFNGTLNTVACPTVYYTNCYANIPIKQPDTEVEL